jgi:hypothetical protein
MPSQEDLYIPTIYKKWAAKAAAEGKNERDIAIYIGTQVAKKTKRPAAIVPIWKPDGKKISYYHTDYNKKTGECRVSKIRNPRHKSHRGGAGEGEVAIVATPSASATAPIGIAPSNSAISLEAIIERHPLTVVKPNTLNPNNKNSFAVITYWWGNENINRNLQRPCVDDPDQMDKRTEAEKLGKEYKFPELYPAPGYAGNETTYKGMIEKWKAQCEKIGVPYIVEQYDEFATKGRYQDAINAKPLFIRKALDTAKKAGLRGVVYIDGDMLFHQYPEIFDMKNVDYMARGWNVDPRASAKYTKGDICFDPYTFETSGGIMYFGDTQTARQLLKEWIDANARPINKGKADDRIISIIVNARQYLLKANIVQLPIEYLWLTDFYDPTLKATDYPGHVRTGDYDPAQIICSHPHCLTTEERAREQGASSNREHILYYRAIESYMNCNRIEDSGFYEYIFFEKEMAAARESYKRYLTLMDDLEYVKKDKHKKPETVHKTIMNWTKYDMKYGKMTEMVYQKLSSGLAGRFKVDRNPEILLDTLLKPHEGKPISLVELYDDEYAPKTTADILKELVKGNAVLWMPQAYKQLNLYSAMMKQQRTQSAHPGTARPGSSARTVTARPGTARRGGDMSMLLGGVLQRKTAQDIKTLGTDVRKYENILQKMKMAIELSPAIEFMAYVEPISKSTKTWMDELYRPQFSLNHPMYFSPSNRVLRHLLLLSEINSLSHTFNMTYIFLTMIRCKWFSIDD